MVNEFKIMKSNADKMQVFGWANVSAGQDGALLEDLQKDIIAPEELEKAAYEYVLKFGDAGERHDPALRQKGKLIESIVFTKEKAEALGIPEGVLPIGWWVGFQVTDGSTWEKVKDGAYKMFSIEGAARREPMEKSAKMYKDFKKEINISF